MRKRNGYTLTEILLAMTIMSAVLVITYQIMTAMMRSGAVTQWESTLTTQFTNSDTRIRSYLDRSSYPSLATPQGTARLDNDSAAKDAFFLNFPGDPAGVEFEASSVSDGQVFLRWYCCEVGYKGLPGMKDAAPRGSKIELVAKKLGRTKAKSLPIFELHMIESPVTFPGDVSGFLSTTSGGGGGTGTDTLMVSDCTKVALKLFARGSSGTVKLPNPERVHVEIEISCVEPTQGNTIRSRKITGQTNVGAKQGT